MSPPRTIIFHSQIMSQTHSTATSSSNFQLIFNSALKAYERRTKQDLLAHPLAAQFQACDSPGAIIAILQQQIQEFNHSRRSDDRFTKWLDPTVNALYTFSTALGEGVGLVRLRTSTRMRSTLSCLPDRCSHQLKWSLQGSASSY